MKSIFKKENLYKIFYLASIIFIILFICFVVYDKINYNQFSTSFPFYVFAYYRCIEFILPAIIELLVGIYLKKRFNKKGDK